LFLQIDDGTAVTVDAKMEAKDFLQLLKNNRYYDIIF